MDFPISFIPDNVIPCGPIYLSSAPASTQNPSLASWLEQGEGKTILINLGSAVTYDEFGTKQILGAVKEVLRKYPVQVLWKFNQREEWDVESVFEGVKGEIKEGRLRLEKWLPIDPAAIMETGEVAISVHHGGANCFMEAVAYVLLSHVPPIYFPTSAFLLLTRAKAPEHHK